MSQTEHKSGKEGVKVGVSFLVFACVWLFAILVLQSCYGENYEISFILCNRTITVML